MNNTNSKQNVTATIAMVAIIAAISIVSGLSTVQAQETPVIYQYDTIAQEDELMAIHNGHVYLNTVYEDHSGNFRLVDDIDTDYSIDQAIERFGINEDVSSFTVQKDWNNDVALVFQLDNDLQFQLIGAIDTQ